MKFKMMISKKKLKNSKLMIFLNSIKMTIRGSAGSFDCDKKYKPTCAECIEIMLFGEIVDVL